MADGDERMLGTGDDSGPDLLYEIARWRLDEQLERVKWQDNKLAATFTLNAAVIALFGVALAFAGREFPYHVYRSTRRVSHESGVRISRLSTERVELPTGFGRARKAG